MAIKLPAIGADGAFFGAGLDAAKRVFHGRTVYLDSPEYGGDPTGKRDNTPALQKAVDDLAAEGGGTIIVSAGDWLMAPPFVQMKGYISIRGEGRFATRFWVDNSKVDSGTEETGVFHTGTYGKRLQDPSLFRTSLSDFSIQVTYKDGTIPRTGTGPFQHIDGTLFNDKVWGICYNTYLGEGPAEPDSVHFFHNIEIWNTAGGVALLGLDDQGCQMSNFRIRKTWKQSFLVGKPADHPEGWEINPNDATKPYRRTGAADNHFFNIDVSSANMSLGGYAGFEIYTSQCYFTQCKAWYVKRGLSGAADLEGTLPTGDAANIWNFVATKNTATPGISNPDSEAMRFPKDGAGYFVNGRDNIFMGCQSQETGGHGWVVNGSCNTLLGCYAESPSFYDCVKNEAKVNEAVGFAFTNWCWGTQGFGLISKNAYPTHKDARMGFYVQKYAKQLVLQKCKAFTMPFVNGVDNTAGEIIAWFPKRADLSQECELEVNDQYISTFAKDNVSAGGSSGGSSAVALELTPAEIGSIVAQWDFSDTSKITSSGGRVSSVAMSAGSATNAALAQADATKQPYLSTLAGKTAIKTKSADLSHLVAPSVGTLSVASGWSVAMVAALGRDAKGQYFFSSPGTGAKATASIKTNDRLSLIANTNGSTNGVTVTSPEKAVSLYAPAVVVMVVDASGMSFYINGVKVSSAPTGALTPNELSSKVAIGAYNDGASGGTDATFGEAVIFSKALSSDEVSGLSGYMRSKWS